MKTMKTDAQMQQDVMAALNWEPAVNASRVGVNVKDGIVTLAGHASSYGEQWCAERAAQGVSGVKSLTTRMDVNLPEPSRRDDHDIARSAESLLRWTTYLPKGRVKVLVQGGWITLSGELDWDFQKQSAAGAIRYLTGVTGVSNRITIKPSAAAGPGGVPGNAASAPQVADGAQETAAAMRPARVTRTDNGVNWTKRYLTRKSLGDAFGMGNEPRGFPVGC
jgi:osmotically-inducible protein OsmY